MAACLYKGKIDHTERSIERLFKTQLYAYKKLYSLVRMGIGLAFILMAAFLAFPIWLKAILLLAGAWLTVSRDFPAQIQADRALSARHGILPRNTYRFFGDHLSMDGEGKMNIPYEKISRLVYDETYFYLFLSKDSVCMMERDSLEKADPEAFMKFIEEKTHLTWGQEKSFLFMNLQDIRRAIRGGR